LRHPGEVRPEYRKGVAMSTPYERRGATRLNLGIGSKGSRKESTDDFGLRNAGFLAASADFSELRIANVKLNFHDGAG
jgi:hypothetical protein